MTAWDSADLLRRCKFHAAQPAVQPSMPDASWYDLLSDAQQRWVGIIAAHAPESQYGAPVQLTETTPGKVWTFPAWPMGHFELRDGRGGAVLTVGAEFADMTDFTLEGLTLRVPSDRTRSFASGVWARYVPKPTVIDATTQPVLQPEDARILLVYEALGMWARRGGLRNPAPWEQAVTRFWSGDPEVPGDIGLMGQLKTRAFGQGLDASGDRIDGRWWVTPDIGT